MSEEYGYFPDIIDWIVVKSLKTSIANQLKRQSSIETGVGQCINITFYKWCFLFLGSDSESLLQSWFVYYQGENMPSAWSTYFFNIMVRSEQHTISVISQCAVTCAAVVVASNIDDVEKKQMSMLRLKAVLVVSEVIQIKLYRGIVKYGSLGWLFFIR